MNKPILKILNGCLGFFHAVALNIECLIQRARGKRVLIFQLHGATQLTHIESLLAAFSGDSRVVCYVLSPPKEIERTRSATVCPVRSYNTSLFLIFWDAVIAVDQGMRLPLVNPFNGHRICMFHGQPSKGNSYHKFNARIFDDLFFYGDMMKQKFLEARPSHPDWQHLAIHDVGQPKSDKLITSANVETGQLSKQTLDIASYTPTVLYAPSFEATGSLALRGEEIISALQTSHHHLIVKPHPAFFRVVNPSDPTYEGVAYALQWHDRAQTLEQTGVVSFPTDHQIPAELALPAADVLVTDHSGIAFDAILLDIPVIFIHCHEFFFQHLPDHYGIDGNDAVNDITCNGGRSAGDVVETITQLQQAVEANLADRERNAVARLEVRKRLLFNPGHATETAKNTILELIKGD